MNSIQRRLFRTFIEAGGDVAEAAQVERFIRYVEAVLSILPPKIKAAIDLAWRAEDMPRYESMAAGLSQPGLRVSASALRQRVSRGLTLLFSSSGEGGRDGGTTRRDGDGSHASCH